MKKIYTVSLLFSFVALTNCSKDILKKYDKRIVGTWQINDVKSFGLGGDTGNLPFTEGSFTFYDDGSLSFLNVANITFQGHWDIIKKYMDNETVHGLEVNVSNFNIMQTLSEYYDDINFTGTDRFNAKIFSGLHTYVTKFRR